MKLLSLIEGESNVFVCPRHVHSSQKFALIATKKHQVYYILATLNFHFSLKIEVKYLLYMLLNSVVYH